MLVYGRDTKIPISLEFPSLDLGHQLELLEDDAMTVRIVELMELEEIRDQVVHTFKVH